MTEDDDMPDLDNAGLTDDPVPDSPEDVTTVSHGPGDAVGSPHDHEDPDWVSVDSDMRRRTAVSHGSLVEVVLDVVAVRHNSLVSRVRRLERLAEAEVVDDEEG